MNIRCSARKFFKEKKLSYDDITHECFEKLIEITSHELKMNNNCMVMKIAEGPRHYIRTGSYFHAGFFVSGKYFSEREAISFNRDGFIGFAGWASDRNAEPFVSSFFKWCDWLSEEKNN